MSTCDPQDCADLWLQAIHLYLLDCQKALRGSEHKDAVSALADFDGPQLQLERLCRPLGIETWMASQAIDLALATDYGYRAHREALGWKAPLARAILSA